MCKKILVPTFPQDSHALVVQKAVRSINPDVEMFLWYLTELPSKTGISYMIDSNEDNKLSTIYDGFKENLNNFDIVWLRRLESLNIPEYAHKDDLTFIHYNCWKGIYSALHSLNGSAQLWINPFYESEKIEDKLSQLSLAKTIGFNIPETLITNKLDDAKNFLSKHGDSILKYYLTDAWKGSGENERVVSYTSVINPSSLDDPVSFHLTPSIIQKRVDKSFEVRVFVIGELIIPALIKGGFEPNFPDWRLDIAKGSEVIIEPIELPYDIEVKCRNFMNKSNLITGSFDLIVDKNNNYYFLEINEMGNFLWMEERNPEIRVLDPFVDFLLNVDSNGNWRYHDNGLQLSDF